MRPLVIDIQLPSLKGSPGSPTKPLVTSPQNFINSWLNTLNSQQQSERIRREIDQEIERMQAHDKRVQAILDDAYTSFSGSPPAIEYTLKGKDGPGREDFLKAFGELQQMLEGQRPMSIKRAVFLYENAYDPTIRWEDYNKEIDDLVEHVGYSLNKLPEANDPLAKNLALFRFFTDTLAVGYPGFEKPVVSYPMLYDFNDFWGREDIRNVFVSKLLKTGTGQCHSLPLLYLILSEEIGARAHLAFSPNHSYIKFQDEYKRWYNVELTNGMFTSDQFILYSGYVNAIALQNKMYTVPLTNKEVVAQSVNDLAIAYIARFGYDDFVQACTNLALKHSRRSMTPHLLYHNLYKAKLDHVIAQYRAYGMSVEEFKKDSLAQQIIAQIKGVQKHLEKLGFADMPAEQYQDWLNSVREESRKQEHRIRMRQIMSRLGNQ